MRQLRLRTPPEGSARGGHDQLAHIGARAGRQCLEERRVLGVDRDDLAGLGQRLHQRAADDERFLVGEREGAARFQGGEGGGEADGTGDAVENGVAVGGGELGGGVRAGQDLGKGLTGCVLGRERLPQRRYDVLARDRDRAYAQPMGLLREQSDPAAGGGQRGDPEPVGVAQHEVDGLGADRAGGAEDHDVPDSVHGVEDEMRISEGGWTVAHPPIVAAARPAQDRAPHFSSLLLSSGPVGTPIWPR